MTPLPVRHVLSDVWTVTAALPGCAVAIGIGLFAAPAMLDVAIDGDSLQPALFVHDAQTHAYAWAQYRQAQIPSFLPDLLVYAALQAGFGGWRPAVLGFGVLDFLGYVAVGAWIAGCASGGGFVRALPLFAAAALGIQLVSLWSAQRGWAAATALDLHLPLYHAGPMVLSLLAAGLAIDALRRPRAWQNFALGALCLAMGQGDATTGPLCIAPLLLVALAGVATGAVRRAAALRVGSIMVGCFMAGAVSTLWLARSYGVLLGAIPFNMLRFFADLPQQPYWCVVLAALGGAGVRAAVLWRRSPAAERFDGPAVWWLFGVAAALATFSFTAAFYQNGSSYRYGLPAIAWLSVLATSWLLPRLRRLPPPLAATALLAAALVAVPWMRPTVLDWRMPLERCLQAAAPDRRAGLGDYWHARPLEASSDWRLQVDQLDADGHAWIWENDPMAYFHDARGSAPPPYSFIVMAGLSAPRIAARYGPPDHVLRCPDSDVWLYDDRSHLQPRVIASNPNLRP
jgi:hypothetical protein